MNNIYSVYICSGKEGTDNYRETGSYTAYGETYTEAAAQIAAHWNKCVMINYGTNWKETGRTEGNPQKSMYVTDEKGNKFLMIDREEKTIYLHKDFQVGGKYYMNKEAAGDIIVGQKDGFVVKFNANTQTYTVLKAGKVLIQSRYRYSDVSSYLD